MLGQFTDVLKNNPASFIFVFYGIGVLIFILPLLCLHISLVSQERTTNENIKKLYKKENPFYKTCISNWFFIACSSRYPNLVNPREKYQLSDDDIEL